MDYVMSNLNNFDVLTVYASMPIQKLLIQSNLCLYDEVSLPSLSDVLSTKVEEFLTNVKFKPYTNTYFTIEHGDIVSEDRLQYGHLYSKQEYGVKYDYRRSHLVDLMNFSFFMMEKDVSISHAAIQSLNLLKRIYEGDVAPNLGTKQFEGVKPYEI